jgi:hypothetical protein
MRFRVRPFFACFTSFWALSLAACGSDVATGGTGGSGGAACASFLPPPTPPWKPVAVHFTNTHKTPFYLAGGGGCAGDPFSLTDVEGKSVRSSSGACSFTCADLQKTSCVCTADCALPPVIYIAPGASLDVTWHGSVFTETTMPVTCFSDASCADTCLVEQAPSGKLTFAASLWTDVQGCDPGQCVCDPGMAGTCQINGPATVTGTELKATAVFTSGTSTSVEIAF